MKNLTKSATAAQDAELASAAYCWIVRAILICFLFVILIAGLWPFHVPKNDVTWIGKANGIEFGHHGSVVSSGAFRVPLSKDNPGCTLEIWARPATDEDNTIVAFEKSADGVDPDMNFSLRQERSDLVVQRYEINRQGRPTRLRLKVKGAFLGPEPVFVTVTGGEEGTRVYLNGVLAGRSETLGFGNTDLSGRMILADSTTHDSWAGQVTGLAVYSQEMTRGEVGQSYDSWTNHAGAKFVPRAALMALYRFDDRGGRVIHNEVDPGTDLIIADRYSVLHPAWMARAWHRFRFGWPGWNYWEDVIINIVGLAPFGFILCAYCSSVRPARYPMVKVVCLGFVLSFMIETAQWLLPTRESDMTDVITNTLGTAVGATLYQCSMVQRVWIKSVAFMASCFKGRADDAKAGIPTVEQVTLSA